MKHTNQGTKKEAKKGTTVGSKPGGGPKREGSNKEGGKSKGSKYKMDFIKKDNFDTMGQKYNITEIRELQVKYVLNCTEGIFKNRFLYITTHKDG